MEIDDKAILEHIIPLARTAGSLILRFYHPRSQAERQNNFPVTEADLASHRFLAEHLRNFSNIGLLSEENLADRKYLDFQTIFLIDPLDGTSDFVNQTDEFSVMIAVVRGAYPVAGVVYQPVGDRLFYASREQGAFCVENGQTTRLQVSPETDFSKMKMLTSRFHASAEEEKLGKQLGIMERQPMGSAGLKMGMIATGQAHVYISPSNKTGEWDSAAGAIIIEEAGGIITDLFGRKLTFQKSNPRNENGFVVSNGVRHEELIAALR